MFCIFNDMIKKMQKRKKIETLRKLIAQFNITWVYNLENQYANNVDYVTPVCKIFGKPLGHPNFQRHLLYTIVINSQKS